MYREHEEYNRYAEELEKTAHRADWFITASGRIAYVMSPELTEIDIVDIAIGLSRICRFGGHVKPDVPFYSVAQHSVIVSHLVPPELAMRGLLHDAPEAFLGDVIRPLKRVLAPLYKPLEDRWALEIGKRFDLGAGLQHTHPLIKAADIRALATERRDLTAIDSRRVNADERADADETRIVPLMPNDARDLFMARYSELHDRTRDTRPQAWVP